MAGAVDFLTADMAQKVHIDAVNRDYICEPHLGAPLPSRVCCIQCDNSNLVAPCWEDASISPCCQDSMVPPRTVNVTPEAVQPRPFVIAKIASGKRSASSGLCLLPAFTSAEYRTVGGVAGPLVVVNTVKVRVCIG